DRRRHPDAERRLFRVRCRGHRELDPRVVVWREEHAGHQSVREELRRHGLERRRMGLARGIRPLRGRVDHRRRDALMDAFVVSARSIVIPLDEGGHGVGSFTVANQTGRSVRARASVSPFPPASSEWFEVDGATERLMSPGASEEFIVRVSAPVGGETVSRSFRLDIASVDRPDDEWAHGPTIGFMLGNGGSQPAYFETAAGALAGAVAGIVVAVIAGLPAWFVDGRPELDTALVLRSLFVPMFAGDLVI